MKKILFPMATALVLMLAFTSCSSDDSNDDNNNDAPPVINPDPDHPSDGD